VAGGNYSYVVGYLERDRGISESELIASQLDEENDGVDGDKNVDDEGRRQSPLVVITDWKQHSIPQQKFALFCLTSPANLKSLTLAAATSQFASQSHDPWHTPY